MEGYREGGLVAQAFWCTDALIPGIRGDDDEGRACVHPSRGKERKRASDRVGGRERRLFHW